MILYAPITPETAGQLSEITQVRCGYITDLAWSSSGDTLAVAHANGIWLWSGDFGSAPTIRLQPHEGPVKSLAFNPDGRLLASASADTTVRLSMLPEGNLVSTIRGSRDSVDALAFSSDGHRLASGGADRLIRVIDFTETARRIVLEGHEDEITALAFGAGLLASASRDATIRLWRDAETVAVLPGHSAWIRDITFHPGETLLASSDRDGIIRLWDMTTHAAQQTFMHDGDSRALAFSADGRLLAAADRSAIRLWNVNNGQEMVRLEGHTRPVVALAFHPGGGLLASGSGDNTIRLWGVASSPRPGEGLPTT